MPRWLMLVFLVTGWVLAAGIAPANAHAGMVGHHGGAAAAAPDHAISVAPSDAASPDVQSALTAIHVAAPPVADDGCCTDAEACGPCRCPGACLPLLPIAAPTVAALDRPDFGPSPAEMIRQPGDGPAPPPPRP